MLPVDFWPLPHIHARMWLGPAGLGGSPSQYSPLHQTLHPGSSGERLLCCLGLPLSGPKICTTTCAAETAADGQVALCCFVRGNNLIPVGSLCLVGEKENQKTYVGLVLTNCCYDKAALHFHTAPTNHWRWFCNIRLQRPMLLWKYLWIFVKDQRKMRWAFCMCPLGFSCLFTFVPSVSLLMHWFVWLKNQSGWFLLMTSSTADSTCSIG